MEYCATVFSDYSKLYLDKWRKYSMKMTRRGSRFSPPPSPSPSPPTKFELYVFSPARVSSSMSIYPSNITQLRKIPSAVNRAHIVDTNESGGPASQITKIRKAIQHLELIPAIISGVKSKIAGTRGVYHFPMNEDGTCLMIATDRPDDNLIVTVPPRRLLHKMTVSMINCALRNAIFTRRAVANRNQLYENVLILIKTLYI